MTCSHLGAAAAAMALACLTLGTALVVALQAQGFVPTPADWAALRFTVLQAALSAAFSVALAVPVARALARRQFRGRVALITLMGAPFLLPVIVAVFGLLAVFGRGGVVNTALATVGLPPISIYGLHGVVLAHVFLNLPLAVRMILQGWQGIPAERFRLAASLGFAPADTFRHLELAMLRAVLPGAAIVIFLLCLTSFAVALTLGGGPRATTIELAIYQALRFDFDLGRAAALAGTQFTLCLLTVAVGWRVMRPAAFGAGLDRDTVMNAPNGWRFGVDMAAVVVAAVFLMVPLGAVIWRGLPGLAELPSGVWGAAGRSVAVALASTTLSMTAGVLLAVAVARGAHWWMEGAAMLPLAASGLVLGTGLFLMLRPLVSPEGLALPVTVVVNAVLTVPFIYRLILPDTRVLLADHGRLAQSLGLRGVAQWRWLILPRLARPLGFGAGVAAALSMGDLGVIALFAGDSGATLPMTVQRLMGAYRMDAAAGAAVLLLGLSFGLFWLLDAGGRRYAAT